jgi:hypothetical protein
MHIYISNYDIFKDLSTIFSLQKFVSTFVSFAVSIVVIYRNDEAKDVKVHRNTNRSVHRLIGQFPSYLAAAYERIMII